MMIWEKSKRLILAVSTLVLVSAQKKYLDTKVEKAPTSIDLDNLAFSNHADRELWTATSSARSSSSREHYRTPPFERDVNRASLFSVQEARPRGAPSNTLPSTREEQTIVSQDKEEVKKCEFIASDEVFWHLGITTKETAQQAEKVGRSAYVLSHQLMTETLEEKPGSFASGTCTRTQIVQSLADTSTKAEQSRTPGGAYCHVTYSFLDDQQNPYSINAAGELFDSYGGSLAINGGTGPMNGVSGEIRIVPYDVDREAGSVEPSDKDIVNGVDLFLVKMTLFQNSCLRDLGIGKAAS